MVGLGGRGLVAAAAGGVLMAGLAGGTLARGGVALTYRNSEATADAVAYGASDFGEADGPDDFDSVSSSDFGAFDSGVRSASSDSSALLTHADSMAQQSSGFTFNGSDLAGANATGEMDANGETSFGLAISSGLSEFDFAFTVSGSPVAYQLTGHLAGTQSDAAIVDFYNLADSSNSIEFVSSSDPDGGNFIRTGVLVPGDYEIDTSGYVFVDESGDSSSASGSYSMGVTFSQAAVPEPATAGALALALAVPAMTRRRRRC